MRRQSTPRAAGVEVIGPMRLRVVFTNEDTLEVDLSDTIQRIPYLAPLKEPRRFKRAALGEFGLTIDWGDGLEVAADNLFARAKEQRGEPSHEMLWEWMHRNGLTIAAAADALGMSQRMLAYYRSGAKPIPKHLWLACLGWESLQNRAA